MAKNQPKSNYPPCDSISRKKPHVVINKDVAEAIGRDYKVLPIFEKGLFEYTYKAHYSLQTNGLLNCRWREYKQHIEDRVFAPFQFLDIRDYHFYICRTRLIPSETIHKHASYRRKLKPGPGVDLVGQMPIPEELKMKRGRAKDKAEKNKAKT